jgi:hypothetical protein
MPYLELQVVTRETSPDGALLTLDLAIRNEDYVTLSPSLGPALVINGDSTYGAYLGAQGEEPVNWREGAKVWAEVISQGVPPLSDQAPEPLVVRVYALAPKGANPWQKPLLYLPLWDKALPPY